MIEEGYDEKYDCYYDLTTGEWRESMCSDPQCEFCVGRPAKHHEPATDQQATGAQES